MTKFLIVKRGLYYRPNSRGYTGIKDHAGRYSLDELSVEFPNLDSQNQDGMSYVAEDEAPDYSEACYYDLKLTHQRDKAELEVQRLKTALWQVANPAGCQSRDDLIKIARDALDGAA